MSKNRERIHGPAWLLVMLTCILTLPMVGELMGYYPNGLDFEALRPAFITGAVLGVANLILRPVLRLVFAPLGCLTLGLFGLVIDLGLIYLSAYISGKYFAEAFKVPSFAYALVSVLVINAICAITAGRK